MKKLSLFVAVALAAGLSSCSGTGSKGNLENNVDSLSYAIGMARTQGLDQFLMQQGIDSTQMVNFVKGFNEGATKLDPEDAAYIIGLQVGQMVSKQWVEGFNRQIFGNDSTQSLNREQMLAGFVAGTLGKEDVMTLMAAQTYMRTEMEAVQEKALAIEFADNKAAGEKFLAENKTKEGVQTTPSGLQYKIITKGNGPVPADTSRVQVNYKGTLIDGTEFDSSYKRKDKNGKSKPATFRANQVIKGWTEALTMMPVGSKWELYIPADLAYGSRNSGKIKPFSTLIFEVELVSIEK
ncbi:MAG: FKBP-type peptidyl-prolyl cis-trans isomerase [Candidatus Bacteroides intestinipullorum]|uniref:Peptidyl-prolyl cis-trans isomerase n=1 Tax=Candidatus Bacteroides intestinipullorum TaxID=2838471 RepID=A0A9E2KHS4_9BACE|nr:FKBP-type peptidyl-prolyl cis-trans isomerase [Candidatus Bacteroides intestinipullorum]